MNYPSILLREWLVKNKYAGKGKVAINGGSNGGTSRKLDISANLSCSFIFCITIGLLVAASVNRAPEGTFGAAVAEVGVLDLLKARIFFDSHIKLTVFVVCGLYDRSGVDI